LTLVIVAFGLIIGGVMGVAALELAPTSLTAHRWFGYALVAAFGGAMSYLAYYFSVSVS